MINIIITSEIKIYCEGLAQILSSRPDFNVLGATASVDQASELIATHAPEIVLFDMTMTGSCELAQSVARLSPKTKIVALAVSYDEAELMQYAQAGVTCYVPREASVSQLIDAIMNATRGECYCPPRVAAFLLSKIQNLSRNYRHKTDPAQREGFQSVHHDDSDLNGRLTRREFQVARLIGEGLSNKQIARDLSIEVSTVKNHVHNVLVKLEVNNRNQAVVMLQHSQQRGWVLT